MPRLGRARPHRPLITKALLGIQFDAAGNSGYVAASANYTVSRTVTGSSPHLAVDVVILGTTAQTVTSVTDDDGGGAVPMVLIGVKNTPAGVGRIESWGLANPIVGTKNLRVILSASVASVTNWVSRTGVHQTSPTTGYVSASGTNVGAANATVDVVTATDGSWVHAAALSNGALAALLIARNNVTGALGTGADEDSGPKLAGTYTAAYGADALAVWAIGGYELWPAWAGASYDPAGGFPWPTQDYRDYRRSRILAF